MDGQFIANAARKSLTAYAATVERKFKPEAMHRVISDALMKVEAGEIKRLMIFAPPRHGKSWLVSRFFPAWYYGKNPDKKIIAASHTHKLAADFGSEVRELLVDQDHVKIFPDSKLRKDSAAKDEFKLEEGGEFYAVGVGGTPIGKGCNIAIIDDPIRNRQEAESELHRQKVKDWYTSSIYSRLEDDGAIVLMHQRWHDDDLAGWLLKEHSHENWHVINLPAIAEEDDYLGRQEGEALTERFPIEQLEKIKIAVGPRDWLSMYQQRPRLAEGDEFKRDDMKIFGINAQNGFHSMNRYIVVDAASSKKKHSDYTGMAVIGLGADQNFYFIDGIRDRLNLTERAEALIALHRKWNPIAVGYEQYGQMADIEHIQSAMEAENYRFHITPLGGKIKKEERIRRMIPAFEAGRWWFPPDLYKRQQDGNEVDIINELVETEMLPFPAGKFDDLLDATSRIYDMNLRWPSGRLTGKSIRTMKKA